MHPFLPVLSLVLLFMGDGAAYYLRRHGYEAPMELHRPALWALASISLLSGAGLAYWLRRFRIHFPFYAALISVAWVILLAVL